jgi:hypothetical protein
MRLQLNDDHHLLLRHFLAEPPTGLTRTDLARLLPGLSPLRLKIALLHLSGMSLVRFVRSSSLWRLTKAGRIAALAARAAEDPLDGHSPTKVKELINRVRDWLRLAGFSASKALAHSIVNDAGLDPEVRLGQLSLEEKAAQQFSRFLASGNLDQGILLDSGCPSGRTEVSLQE